MLRKLFTAAAIWASLSSAVYAVPVGAGDTIRGSYAFATFGAQELEPNSLLLRLSPADLFGGVDAVGVRILDTSLTPLLFTRVDALTTALDATVGLPTERSDFLPGVLGPSDPARIPRTGFVEITGLAGSFDVASLTFSGIEVTGAIGITRQAQVTEFEPVTTPMTPVPLPAPGLLLAGVLGGFLGLGFWKHGQKDTIKTA
ncbi:hypothetical protein [Roseibium sp. MMSF_3412]|uniref:hypothetical protein n=1 Tax=Roseibium sp. MMSF_3412 TaxID=3046712 RepID=UPI00273F90A0|nr:hypothetical protein [Roseibium sp. MMSF_3412]